MPIFEYQCKSCGHKFEKLQKRSDEAPRCPKCDSEVKRLLSSFSCLSQSGGGSSCATCSGGSCSTCH